MARSEQKKGKPFPHLTSDEEMERFVETADLSEYDFSEFKPIKLVFRDGEIDVTMPMKLSLFNSLKVAAIDDGVSYQHLMTEYLEKGLAARADAKSAARKKAS